MRNNLNAPLKVTVAFFRAIAARIAHRADVPIRILLFTILCCGAVALQAQTSWTGAVNTDWDNAGNWTAGVPTASSNVTIIDFGNDPVISTAAVAKSVLLYGYGKLTIAAGGTLTISGAQYEYLTVEGGCTLNNSGGLNISDALSSTAIWNAGTINNYGTITFEHTWNPFFCDAGVFNNYGAIDINLTVGVKPYSYGIDLFDAAKFNNHAGATIHIGNTYIGLRTNSQSAVVTNSGDITIEASVDIGIINGSNIFHNMACATINCSTEMRNYSGKKITNDGFMTVNTTVAHGSGLVINNGIIEYPQGNPIPGVTNNEIIVLPNSTACLPVMTNALELGSPVDFSIASNWYFDQNLNQLAGTYNVATNTFTANAGFGGQPRTVYYSISDLANGCSRTVSQQLQFVDNTAPSLTCPAGLSVACADNVPAQNISLVSATDNCGAPVVSFVGDVISNQTCSNRYTLTRQYRATDEAGNSATCSQIITVNDQTPPVFTFVPASTTVDCYQAPGPGIGTPTASDNCTSGATVTFLGETNTPGICPILYTLKRTWSATDACGNVSTATQTVTVIDSKAPNMLTQAQNVIPECGPNNATQLQAWLNNNGGATAQDCGPISWAATDNPGNFDLNACGNTFKKYIRFVATDQCGNTAYTDAYFVPVDNSAPVFTTLPQNVELECENSDDNGEVAFYDWLDNNAGVVAEDACGTVTLQKVLLSQTQGCGNTWRKTYEFRATDQCGNISKINASFRVTDHTPPTLNCLANDPTVFACVEDVPAPDPSALSADDCSGVTLSLLDSWTNGTGCPGSPMTVAYLYAATDGCGNQATCERAYYVQETKSPALVCPDTIKVVCMSDIPGPAQVFGYIKTLLAGNCPGGFSSINILTDSGQPLNGATHRTYSLNAKNHCGLLTKTCSVTFLATGSCNQLCTASQDNWGDANGTIGGMPADAALQTLLTLYGPVTTGGDNHTVSAADAACVQDMLSGSGGNGFLPSGHFACPLPASLANPDGSLNNQVAARAMALQLNIWYNRTFNDRDFGIQDIHNLPPCLVDFNLLKDLGQASTVQDLLDLSNLYLQGFWGYYDTNLPTLLDEALKNLNEFRSDCGLNAPCERPAKSRSGQSEGSLSELRAFPNPATEAITLQFMADQATENADIQISDANGKVQQLTRDISRGLNEIHLSLRGMSAGVYSANVRTGGDVRMVRFVVVRE